MRASCVGMKSTEHSLQVETGQYLEKNKLYSEYSDRIFGLSQI